MLKSLRIVLLLGVSSIMFVACWPVPKSGPTSQGKPIPIFVLVDPGIEKSFTDYQVKNRKQTSAWMEKDIEKMLKKAGYAGYLISKRSEYKAAPGTYLLTVKNYRLQPRRQSSADVRRVWCWGCLYEGSL